MIPHQSERKLFKHEGHPDKSERGTPILSLRVRSWDIRKGKEQRINRGVVAADGGVGGLEEHRAGRLKKGVELSAVADRVGQGVVGAVIESTAGRRTLATLVLHNTSSGLMDIAVGLAE